MSNVVSNNVMSNNAVSNNAVSNNACPIIQCPIMSCPIMRCPIVQCSCPIMRCPIIICPKKGHPCNVTHTLPPIRMHACTHERCKYDRVTFPWYILGNANTGKIFRNLQKRLHNVLHNVLHSNHSVKKIIA